MTDHPEGPMSDDEVLALTERARVTLHALRAGGSGARRVPRPPSETATTTVARIVASWPDERVAILTGDGSGRWVPSHAIEDVTLVDGAVILPGDGSGAVLVRPDGVLVVERHD